MRKSKIIIILCLIAMLCGLLSACGSTETGNNVVGTEVSNVTEETKNSETTPIYEEGTDVFLISNNVYGQDYADGKNIDMNSLNPKGGKVVTEGELLIYNQRKENIGYVKSGVTMTLASQSDEWTYVYVTDGGFIVRTEDIKDLTVGRGNQNNVEDTESSQKVEDSTYTETSKIMYAKQNVNVRSGPSTDYGIVGSLNTNDEVVVTGETGTGWYQIKYNDGNAYVKSNYLTDTKVEVTSPDDGGNTNEDENNSEEEYTPPTDDIYTEPELTPTYTVDEVISIVRNTLESNGFMWSVDYATPEAIEEWGPSLGMGWGMEYVPMDDPYTYANSMVEGAVYWGYDLYYLEYQSTENGCVVLVSYWGTRSQ